MRIFVTVGNAAVHFNRLLTLVDDVLGTPGASDVVGVCQYGTGTVHPKALRCAAMLSRTEFEEELRRADVVITHAGVGSVSAAIRAGHRPIVVPRRQAHNEVVNDHQFEIGRELAARGLIVLVEDARGLHDALRSATRSTSHVNNNHSNFAAIERSLEAGPTHATRGAAFAIGLLARLAPPLERLRIR